MSVTEELLTNYQHLVTELTLVTGAQGIFDVSVDDQVIYSKQETGRKPNTGEVLALFEARLPEGTRRYGD